MSDSVVAAKEAAELRIQLVALLKGGQAHVTLAEALKEFPAAYYAAVPAGLPYSAWQILEHMRITQRDILNFSAPPTGGYHALEWPADYWPQSPAPPNSEAWDQTIAAVDADLASFIALLQNPTADLSKPFRWGRGAKPASRSTPDRRP